MRNNDSRGVLHCHHSRESKNPILKILGTVMLLLIAGLSLSGCGFHLRKPIVLPPTIHSLYVQTSEPNRSFIITLKDLLASNNLAIAPTPQLADVTLIIHSITQSTQLAALSGSAEAGQYELMGQVTFSVIDKQGRVLIPTTFVRSTQSYTSNATQVLSTDSQIQLLWRAMQKSLAEQILSQLAKMPSTPLSS